MSEERNLKSKQHPSKKRLQSQIEFKISIMQVHLLKKFNVQFAEIYSLNQRNVQNVRNIFVLFVITSGIQYILSTRISQQEQAECPCCRQVLIQLLSTKPRLLYHLLHKIKLYCRYKNQGCQEIIDYEFRLKHEMNSCQFRLVDCQNCKEQVLFKDLKQHEITCNDEAIECDKCCELLKKFSLQDHKDNECSKRKVQCPSCNLSLEYDQLIGHYFQCPLRCITCEDCKATFAYVDSAEHTQIICLTRQRNYFKKKCNQLRNQNRKLLKKKEQLEFIREYYGIPSDEEQW